MLPSSRHNYQSYTNLRHHRVRHNYLTQPAITHADRITHTILSGIPPSFPNYLWEKLLPQTELSLKLLRQSIISPLLSAWEAFNGHFNFNATPLSPIGC